MTIRQSFGQRTNPSWDALRVQTLSVLGGIAVNSGSDAGLLNRIYVWHADTSTLGVYFPDESGINDALAAAAAGDTIWLPSVAIALTSGKIIPAGVTLIGLSLNSILSFSGFSGTALTLSTGSFLCNCRIQFVSSGSDEIAIDATVHNARVENVWPQVSGVATNSIKLLIGKTATAEAIELWFATSSNFPSTSINQVGWKDLADGSFHAVAALPTNLKQINGFKVAVDGSAIYLMGNLNSDIDWRLWRCANPKAGSPTWTLIVEPDEVISAGTITSNGVIGPLFMYDTTLLFRVALTGGAGGAYGEYDGAWTWWGFSTMQAAAGIMGLPIVHRAWQKTDESPQHIHIVPGGGAVGSGWLNSAATDPIEMWQNLIGGNRYTPHRTSSIVKIFDIDANTDPVNFGVDGDVQDVRVRGALRGAATFATFGGQLWLAENGTTFSHVNDWSDGGPIEDGFEIGGGDLYWIVHRSIDLNHGSVFLKKSANRGSTFTDATQDYWTALRGDGGKANVIDMGLVYA